MGGEAIAGAALHVAETAGPPGAPLLVLVNSLGCDLRIWDGVVPHLARVARVLRYDKRGHGLSDEGAPPYTVETHAADLAALIAARGTAPAIVCGLSIGGLIAQALALARPERVRALVLCATAARIGTTERYAERIARVRQGGVAAIADEQMGRWFSDGFRARNPSTVAVMRNMLVRQPPAGYLGSVAAVRDADYQGRLAAIRAPTLCLTGSEDRSTPPAGVRALAGAIPAAAYAEVPGAGHLPCLEAPDVMAKVIVTFLRERGVIGSTLQ